MTVERERRFLVSIMLVGRLVQFPSSYKSLTHHSNQSDQLLKPATCCRQPLYLDQVSFGLGCTGLNGSIEFLVGLNNPTYTHLRAPTPYLSHMPHVRPLPHAPSRAIFSNFGTCFSLYQTHVNELLQSCSGVKAQICAKIQELVQTSK